MTPRTLVYLLGSGSRYDDTELRISLRSAARHFPPSHVVVVGECPDWMQRVQHVPTRDRYGIKEANTWHKLATAVEFGNLGPSFTLMADDFVFLRPFDVLPVHHRGDLGRDRDIRGVDGYYRRLRTKCAASLRVAGIPEPKDFDVHFPMTMATDKAREMFATFGGSGQRFLLCSMYANATGARGTMIAEPTKCNTWSPAWVDRIRASVGLLSLSDPQIDRAEVRRWLFNEFPDRSPFER